MENLLSYLPLLNTLLILADLVALYLCKLIQTIVWWGMQLPYLFPAVLLSRSWFVRLSCWDNDKILVENVCFVRSGLQCCCHIEHVLRIIITSLLNHQENPFVHLPLTCKKERKAFSDHRRNKSKVGVSERPTLSFHEEDMFFTIYVQLLTDISYFWKFVDFKVYTKNWI